MTDERPPHKVITQQPGFAIIPAAARDRWRSPGTKLTPVCMMVYIALVMRANRADDSCFPSVDTIADEAACSRRSAIDALKTLATEGLISVTPRYRDERRQTSNLYTILDVTNPGGVQIFPGRGANIAREGCEKRTPNQNHSNQKSRETNVSQPAPQAAPDAADSDDEKKAARRKKKQDADDIRHFTYVDAYGRATGQDVRSKAKRTNAKRYLKDLPAKTTPEEVEACVGWMMSDPFYSTRAGAINPSRVLTVFGEWVKKGKPAAVDTGKGPAEPEQWSGQRPASERYKDKEL